MSYALGTRAAAIEAEQNKAETALGRAAYRMRAIKIVCALLLGVCFWYSVPYYLPLKVDPDPMKAAANEAQAYEGNFSRQVAMPIILLIAGYMLWRLPKRGRMQGRLMMIGIVYLAWVMVSFSWSVDPAITGKRLVVFGIDAFFAYTIARVFSVLEMALWGYITTGTVGLISLFVDVFVQHIFAPTDPDYRFNGVMTANYQAMNLLVCVVCGLTLIQRRPRWAKWIVPSLGLMLALMYLTRARMGSIICLLLMVFAIARIMRTRMQPQGRAMAIIAILMVAAPALIYVIGRSGGANAAQSAFMMGRTDTQNTSNLSNRAPLWAELMESVEERPWLGFGYHAFWAPERVEKISADQGWMVPHAHNTYLDETLSLGVIGAVLYIALLMGALIVAWKRYFHNRTETDMMPALLLTWMVLTSFAESVPLDPYLPSMFAYISIVKMCMAEGSEAESDALLGPEEIIGGLTPQTLEAAPRELQAAAASGRWRDA